MLVLVKVVEAGAESNSEIRAVFFHITSLSNSNDWNLIVNTLSDYNISILVIEGMMPSASAYPSNVMPTAGIDFIDQVVPLAHAKGIEVHIAMDVLYTVRDSSHAMVDANGNLVTGGAGKYWTSPVKQTSRDYIKDIVEELVTNYPEIDGFMFDYMRYPWQYDQANPNVPANSDYSIEMKSFLESLLGETITNWPGDFAPGGSRYKEFLELRIEAINQLVEDMIGWMKAIKPDLKISSSPKTIVKTGSGYDWAESRILLGQDWTDWVRKGYMDWVAPMAYYKPDQLETFFRPSVKANIDLGVGGPEGEIPMIIFIANQFPILKTPQEFKQEIDIIREEGADGWIIWKYGGPGVGGTDIRSYLDIINLPSVFSIENIQVYSSATQATISWDTDKPATSKVEYSTSPLFTASLKYDSGWDFNYWDIDYTSSTTAQDATPVTTHSITLNDLQPGTTYYYRVQSQDSSGIATSKVYSSTTSIGEAGTSEIRAVFVHGLSMAPEPDFEQICNVLQSYEINTMIVEMLYPHGSRYPSTIVPSYTGDLLTPAINCAHARGMKVIASFNVLLGAYNDEQAVEDIFGNPRLDNYGNLLWTSPVKSASRAHLEALTRELASFQSQFGSHAGDTIDGFMFDYIRYHDSANNRDYSSEARTAFENWLGEGSITDWTPFYYGGARYNDYLEWSVTTIDDLVRDMRTWILEENPDMEISAAVWTPVLSNNPTINRKDLGQDSAYWISQGWLDWVAPMLYSYGSESLITAIQQYANGGPEGKIPVAPFITQSFIFRTPAEFNLIIETLRANGGDGWAIWEYGGPGDFAGAGPDIRPYFDAMNLYPTFSLENIQALSSKTEATITWTTDLPATSKVEYNTSPLFDASLEYQSYYAFNYWDVDHIPGSIEEDATPVTSHSITLSGLQSDTIYYYRIQSQDANAIATSKVYTFTTGMGGTLNPKISGALKDKNSNPMQASVTIYNQGTSTVVDSTQTDASGNYELTVPSGTYDIQFDISTFYIKLLSIAVTSNIADPINYVEYNSDRLTFDADITTEQSIQVFSSRPDRVLLENSEIEDVVSLPLRKNTWYHLGSILDLKINPDLMADCLVKFDCCVNEEKYLDKTCTGGLTCSNNICVLAVEKSFGKTDIGSSQIGLGPDYIQGGKFYLGESGTVNSMSVYAGPIYGADKRSKAYIYDNSLNYLGSTSEITATENNWNTFGGISLPLNSGDYWLVVHSAGNWMSAYDTGDPNQYLSLGGDYDLGPPSSLSGGSYASCNMSIFANYTTS